MKKKVGFFIDSNSKYIYDRVLYRLTMRFDRLKVKLFGHFLKKIYKYGFGPASLSLIALLFAVLANILVYHNRALFVAFFILYYLFDILDGASAKTLKVQTKWGAALDDSVDLAVAFMTFVNIGYFSGYFALGALAAAFLFFEEWLYGTLHRISVKKVPLHSHYYVYILILLGYYAIAYYISILVSALGILIAGFLFLKAKVK